MRNTGDRAPAAAGLTGPGFHTMADLSPLAEHGLAAAGAYSAVIGMDTPFMAWRPMVLSAQECTGLSALLDQRPLTAGNLAGGRQAHHVRACQSLWLDDDASTAWLFTRLAALAAAVNRERFDFALAGFEGVQLLRYPAGAGHYGWHIDRAGHGAAARRKLSFSIQLSAPDSYQGGRLQLNGDGHLHTAPRGQGGAVLFPSYVLHRVTKVTSGQRDALVGWLEGPDFR